MLQSQLFTKTKKDAPKDELSKNSRFLIRAGYIDKLQAGVYSYLPLGFRVLKKIENIIREEMNNAGAQEILMPALHPIENYKKTGRENIDVLFHTQTKNKKDIVLGQSHEEIITPLLQNFVNSYKDLPLYIYQIQTKFRNELRAKSGILRGREFLMKDLYSFHADEKDFFTYYEKMKQVYANIFKRMGIGEKTFLTFASGGTFSKYSHEFQTTTEYGEDTIYLCEKCALAINKEIIKEQSTCPECGNKSLDEQKSIEVGNIFPLKTKFSDAFSLTYTNKNGESAPVIMGCYGIGLGRTMGTIAEMHSDNAGLAWPEAVSPFKFHLLSLGEDRDVVSFAKEVYDNLQKNDQEVLWDNRSEINPGEKLKDSDLIGITHRLIVSNKTKNKIEYKNRFEKEANLIDLKKLASL